MITHPDAPNLAAQLLASTLRSETALQLLGHARAAPNEEFADYGRAIDGTLFILGRTGLTALEALRNDDPSTAGTLVRKALEYCYVLNMVADDPARGFQCLNQWSARSLSRRFHDLQRGAGSAPFEVDRTELGRAAAAYRSRVPNGDNGRVTADQLAKWANMTQVHELEYSPLNAAAHFDLYDAFAVQAHVRGNGPSVADLGWFIDLCTTARALESSTIYALKALVRIGPDEADYEYETRLPAYQNFVA